MRLVCGGDAMPDVRVLNLDAARVSRVGSRDVVPVWPVSGLAEMPAARSRFEALALLAGRVPPKAGDLLGVLLASTFPVSGGGCEVLRPLWAEEAMHRAYGFMRLVHARNHRGALSAENPFVAGLADTIACDLAIQFRELEPGAEREVLPCSAILRDVVTGFGALFGGPANVTFRTRIEDVVLPAYKRRALVLAAAELVSNALLHAFRGRRTGRVEVDLTTTGRDAACLRVADNGIGFTDLPPNLECGVASGMAGLLEADVAYDRLAGWTIAEIAFPVDPAWPGH